MLGREDFSVLWLCALAESELPAAIAMLDEEYDLKDISLPEWDSNTYVFGSVHGHDVVIACMPLNQPGLVSTATFLAPIQSSFPNLKTHLFVGIAGGIPRYLPVAQNAKDVYLGDVVLGVGAWAGLPAVLPVDYRRYEGTEQINLLGQCNQPDNHLLQAVNLFMANIDDSYRTCQDALTRMGSSTSAFTYPGLDQDRLYASDHLHRGEPHTNCTSCGFEGLARNNLSDERGKYKFKVHKGSIASANSILEDAKMRDEIQKHWQGVLCYDMEAAAVAYQLRPLVVRGIVDYCDSHRSNKFIGYAAATAASVAKQILFYKRPSVKRIQAMPMSKEAQVCLTALYVTDPYLDREALISTKGQRTAGTCEWIKDNKTYKSWIEQDQDFIWISGGPGKGKTMLSIWATEELQRLTKQMPNADLLYFFCSNQDESRSTAVAVLKGLLYQILKKHPSMAEHILQSTNSLPEDQKRQLLTLSTVHGLWAVFKDIIEDQKLGTVFCWIDGLDECDEESIKVLLTRFRNLPQKNDNPFKLAIVSRDLHSLHKIPTIRLDSDIDDQAETDIERFILSKVEELSDIDGFDDEFGTYVKETFLKRAEGTFLWVGLAMAEISQLRTCTEVQEALESIPKGLPSIYSRMLLGIEAGRRSQMRRLLCWVTMAARPLKLHEIVAILGLSPPPHVSHHQFTRDFIRLFAPFLQIREQDGADEVWLIHQSAKYYLLREDPDHGSPELDFLRIKPKEAHLELARFCLDCMEHSDLQRERLRMYDIERDTTSPFLLYAVDYFIHHVRLSEENASQIFDTANPFFYRYSLLRKNFWETSLQDSWPSRNTRYKTRSLLFMAAYFGVVPWIERLIGSSWKRMLQRPLTGKDDYGRSLLHVAAESGHEAAVELLLRLGADIDSGDSRDNSPLILACKGGHTAVIELLLSHGASTEAKNMSNWNTALVWAARCGHMDATKVLLSRSTDIQGKDSEGHHALLEACYWGNHWIVEMLLNSGLQFDAEDEMLMTVAKRGHIRTMEVLLKFGADSRAKNYQGETAAQVARESDHHDICQLLLAHEALSDHPSPPKHKATEKEERKGSGSGN
ncbi:hypothetical protein MMC10_000667 [Thelotrema lepadinum]|nr:hypothetical protein [Thelotrema lepadinum]